MGKNLEFMWDEAKALIMFDWHAKFKGLKVLTIFEKDPTEEERSLQ